MSGIGNIIGGIVYPTPTPSPTPTPPPPPAPSPPPPPAPAPTPTPPPEPLYTPTTPPPAPEPEPSPEPTTNVSVDPAPPPANYDVANTPTPVRVKAPSLTERYRQEVAALQPEPAQPLVKIDKPAEPAPRVETNETARTRAEIIARTAYQLVAQAHVAERNALDVLAAAKRSDDASSDKRDTPRPVQQVSRAIA